MIVYNENDPFAAQWLRNLSNAEHVAPGVVDERSIIDLEPADVMAATQFHAFAGIGGWSRALRLAGWPDDEPVWTGSCPCQPFSVAGKRKGTDDARHLWPEWYRLIKECRPTTIFGEQVASPDGRKWLDNVSLDLEALGYAVGSADLCAAGVGAPHIRQRLWFVAHADGRQRQRGAEADGGNISNRANTGRAQSDRSVASNRGASKLAHADNARSQRRIVSRDCADERVVREGGLAGGFWDHAEWIPCRDGKARAIEPGTFPLAHGVPNRVGRLRGYGNAIVPQVASEFIRAAISAAKSVFSL